MLILSINYISLDILQLNKDMYLRQTDYTQTF